MVNPLEQIFPGLSTGDYQITSPSDPDYNCIAWVVGDTRKWWWPGPDLEREYWPVGVDREITLAAFQTTLATLGYVGCVGEELEPGFEKVAVFAAGQGKPRHAARQLPNGRWTSKLGQGPDIEHSLHDLEGAVYGLVVLLMKRPLRPGTLSERSAPTGG
jgi:hypothetical protein